MNKNGFYYRGLLLAFCCIYSFNLFAGIRSMNLQQALKTNSVIMTATGTGGALGRCINLSLKNITCNPINLKIDQALIFKPADLRSQDLVLVGGDSVRIEPDKTASVPVQTFCAKSDAASPVKGLRYYFSKQGSPDMIKAMNYIRKNQLYNYIGQHAVWVFTNGHCINTIYSELQPDLSKKMLAYVAELQHIPIPESFMLFNVRDVPGRNMIRGKGRQYVEMNWKNNIPRNMYVTVYRRDGHVYKTNRGNERYDGVNHIFTVSFDPEKERGSYYVELRDDDNKIWGAKQVYIGNDMCKLQG